MTPIPSIQSFCVDLPLYAEYPLEDPQEGDLLRFLSCATTIDCFCLECDQKSVFTTEEQDTHFYVTGFDIGDRTFSRVFICSRNVDHCIYFYFRVHNCKLSKVGQSPSLADLSETDLRQYKKVISNDEYRELTKAVGLAAHGVGIGSFVYLRRIFERLIAEAANAAINAGHLDEEAYKQARMEDKIDLLKHELPPFLVTNRKLYSVLSKGIHTLTEDECLTAFPVVRGGIESILDQKVYEKNQRDKHNALTKHLDALHGKISKV